MPSGFTAKAAFGQCSKAFKEAPRGSPLAVLNQDVHISAPVGRRGVNAPADVKIIQAAFKAVPERFGGRPAIKVDGIVGPITQGAIDDFQRLHFGSDKVDGTVEVKHRTQAKLSSLQPRKLARMELVRAQLRSARDCIDAALNTLALAGVESGAAGRNAAAMVERHFSISQRPDAAQARREITGVFRDMKIVFARQSAFGNDGFGQHFEAEPFSNRGIFAFTWFNGFSEMGVFGGVTDDDGRDQRWFRHDTVYLSAFYDVTTIDDRIQTIVHELAHFVGPGVASADRITDHAYGDVDNPVVAGLPALKKMHNAESYGNFAFEARFGRSPAHKT